MEVNVCVPLLNILRNMCRMVSFLNLTKIAVHHEAGGGREEKGEGVSPILFKIFVDHLTIFNSSPVQHLRYSSS